MVCPVTYRSYMERQPPLALSQEAVCASAGALRMINDNEFIFPHRSFVLHSTGTSALEPLPCAPDAAIATIGAFAVLGVMKCLRYELPSLTAAPIDAARSGTDAPARRHGFIAVPGKFKFRYGGQLCFLQP